MKSRMALRACVVAVGLALPRVASAEWGQQTTGQYPAYGSSPSGGGQTGGYGQGGAYGGGSQGGYGTPPPGGAQNGTGLQAGGLAPPSSSPADTESQRTEAKLEEAEEKDSGRGLEFVYLNGEIGITHLGLQTFSSSQLVDAKVVDTTQTGPSFGAGLGLRFVFITLGGRFRLASFSAYQLWTLDAEVGLRIPIGSFEPYVVLAGGYASLGAFDAKDLGGVSSSNVGVHGYDIRTGGGLDYYLTPVFSVGVSVTGELLVLSRPGVDPSKIQPVASGGTQRASDIYAADGSSLGFGLTGALVLGLHF